jgi:hypothetical protein
MVGTCLFLISVYFCSFYPSFIFLLRDRVFTCQPKEHSGTIEMVDGLGQENVHH